MAVSCWFEQEARSIAKYVIMLRMDPSGA